MLFTKILNLYSMSAESSQILHIGCIMAAGGSELPPNHLVNHSHIALNYLHDFCADILVCVGRDREAVVAILHKFYGSLNRLEQTIGVDA